MAIIQTTTINLDINGDDALAHLARPDDDRPHPGLVLIQEVWGIEPHIRDLAQRLAAEGFVVLVPDFFHGKIATEFEDARKIAMLSLIHISEPTRPY